MKKCFKCEIEKPLTEFYKHRQMFDGHLNKCKECAKADVRKDRQVSENAREYDKRRYYETPKRSEGIRKYTVDWINLNPEARKAHWAVSNAIRSGRLVKEPCSQCGAIKNIHAHHPDYSKKLDVIWLCARCHANLHTGVTNAPTP